MLGLGKHTSFATFLIPIMFIYRVRNGFEYETWSLLSCLACMSIGMHVCYV